MNTEGSDSLCMSLPCFFCMAGTQSGPLSTGSACSFSPHLCCTGVTARRGEKLRLVSFVPKLQRGSRSLPRPFQLRAGIYQHANLRIRHGSHCLEPGQVEKEGRGERAWAVREDSSHEESGLRGDGHPLASRVKAS